MRIVLLVFLLVIAPLGHTSTLKYCSEGSPAYLDPMQSSAGTDFDVHTALFDSLAAAERGTQNIVPGLATSWDISKDGLVYTFKLRAGVKFHTTPWFKPSRDFNADDVVFTHRRQIDRNLPFRKAYPAESLFAGDLGWEKLIAKVEKVDALTVRMTLREPSAPFIEAAAHPFTSILSEEYARNC